MGKEHTKHLVAPRSKVTREMREARQLHKGAVFWLTGLSGAGKSSIGVAVEASLFKKKYNIVLLDGDVIRMGLCAGLGFSDEERAENIRRVAEVAKIFATTGMICICAFISPTDALRSMAHDIIGEDMFHEIFIDCSLEICMQRDVKGNYQKARSGIIANYTGVSAPYEAPRHPKLIIQTANESLENCAHLLEQYICRAAGHTSSLP